MTNIIAQFKSIGCIKNKHANPEFYPRYKALRERRRKRAHKKAFLED